VDQPHNESLQNYWTLTAEQIAHRLEADPAGLTSDEAHRRLKSFGRNDIGEPDRLSRLRVLWSQISSPLQLLLVFAAAASVLTGQWTDATIVLSIVVVSSAIGYSREYRANLAAEALKARIRIHSQVIRDGSATAIPFEDVVPGDVVMLSAGSLVPADAVVIEAEHCYVSEATLTGESFPVEKRPGVVEPSARLAERTNCVFAGSNVRSGTARCLVVRTGHATQFGAIAHRLSLRPPETEFNRGVRRFGYMLTVAMLAIALAVFAVHVFRGRAPVETLLFAVALAVGLSPELLPAILSVSLARGAKKMAAHGVLVRHLSAIENLGSMDVLCTDKTGTLTEGVVNVEGAYLPNGQRGDEPLNLAAINAALETGLSNPLDDAILQAHPPRLEGVRKLAEAPFDFSRKRVSVAIETPSGRRLITKGAFDNILEICDLTPTAREEIEAKYRTWSERGIRVLAVASRELDLEEDCGQSAEAGMTFAGFVTFLDRPKEGAAAALAELSRLGVSVKIITGDSRFVAEHVARLVGMRDVRVLTGADLDQLLDEALWNTAESTDLFAEVDPNQKERIILALKKTGHVVGFLGDGVNDAPAMHSADTSLSVESAVDVARQAADFVLLEKGLDVITDGISEGRKTFANTLKYILTTTSANLGNMVSMAVASLFLPFLPLLAGQVLLNNFLSDIPAVGIADDAVDDELLAQPRRWDMSFIGRFMVEFGLLSSVFDFVTFALLLGVFRTTPEAFRTGWFMESLLTELAIAMVVRTRRPFYASRPGRVLYYSTVGLMIVTLTWPLLPFVSVFGFVPVPPALIGCLAAVVLLYVAAAEALKQWFYRQPRTAA
jgi:Mg2+-importing ATPase